MDVIVSCIVNVNNNILLLKTEKGLEIPSKLLQEKLLLKECAIKAVKEQTSFDVLPNAMFGVYDSLERGYTNRTLGIFYITHLDISNEDAEKKAKDFSDKIIFLPITEITKEKFAYDHGLVLTNYFRLLMLGSQTFKSEK
jgi:ADP-ribose pyrophosphatase YjhB (NUDIX family)